MGRVIVIANQKGGVGKTTTAISLGACLAKMGKKVLIIDTDSQGNLATGLGVVPPPGQTIYEVMIGRLPIEDVVIPTEWDNLYIIPSDVNLAAAELELVSEIYRESILKGKISGIRDKYDFIILDSPPSLGLLTINNLSASDSVIIPLQCEYYALEGLSKLLDTIKLVMDNINPDLTIDGVLMTMYDARTRLSKRMVEEVRKAMGSLVFETIIPRTIKIAEAPDVGKPIIYYMPYHKGAKAYLALADEYIARLGVSEGERVPELPEDFASHAMSSRPARPKREPTPPPQPAPGSPMTGPAEPTPAVSPPEPASVGGTPTETAAPGPTTEDVTEVSIDEEEAELKALSESLGQKLKETIGPVEPKAPEEGEIGQELDKLMKEVDTLSDRMEQMKGGEAEVAGGPEQTLPVDDEQARREEYLEDLNVLREQGYTVDRMLNILERDIHEFEEAYPAFIVRVARAEALRERLDGLRLPDHDKVVLGTIRSLLMDPDRVEEAERHIVILERGIAASSPPEVTAVPTGAGTLPLGPYEEKMELWETAGFDVGLLRKILSTGDQARIEKNFRAFEQRVERLVKMEEVVDRIRAPALQEDIERLRPLLKDVTRYKEAKEIFQGIVARVKKR